MACDDVKKEVKKFILEEFLPEGYVLKDDEFLFDTGVFDTGVIDSLGMIKLMAFIEKTFDVVINPSEVTMDNFNTVEKIVRIINEKINKNV